MGFPTVASFIRSDELWFQSLVGIYGFSDLSTVKAYLDIKLFQSLVGIYGFSDTLQSQISTTIGVSIPGRDLWVFRPPEAVTDTAETEFQSLVGIYGFSDICTG